MLGFGGVWGMDDHNAENDDQNKDNGDDHPTGELSLEKRQGILGEVYEAT
jgi:hypothetical protein